MHERAEGCSGKKNGELQREAHMLKIAFTNGIRMADHQAEKASHGGSLLLVLFGIFYT